VFGKLIGLFTGCELVPTEKLLLPIREVTRSIGRAELESVVDA
jgi:hypothetical protein